MIPITLTRSPREVQLREQFRKLDEAHEHLKFIKGTYTPEKYCEEENNIIREKRRICAEINSIK